MIDALIAQKTERGLRDYYGVTEDGYSIMLQIVLKGIGKDSSSRSANDKCYIQTGLFSLRFNDDQIEISI